MILKCVDHGEGLQVLHYDEGKKYETHYDYFVDKFNAKNICHYYQ